MLLKPCSIQPLWLFQLTMPHLSAAGRKIPTWILKISMHSFKSHPFNQVLKITVHLNCLLPLPIPEGGGRGGETTTHPKQSKTSPAHTGVHAHAHKRALILEASLSPEREVPLSAQFLASSRNSRRCTRRHRAVVDTVPCWAAS